MPIYSYHHPSKIRTRPIFHSGLFSPVFQHALPVVVPVVHALSINLDTDPLDKVRCASHNRLGHIVHMHSRYNCATLTTVPSRELLWRAWELGQDTRCRCAGRQLPTPSHCHKVLNHCWEVRTIMILLTPASGIDSEDPSFFDRTRQVLTPRCFSRLLTRPNRSRIIQLSDTDLKSKWITTWKARLGTSPTVNMRYCADSTSSFGDANRCSVHGLRCCARTSCYDTVGLGS